MARDRKLAKQAERRAAAEEQAAAFYKEGRKWWYRAVLLIPVIVAASFLSVVLAILLGVAFVALFVQGLRIAVRGTKLLESVPAPD
jgi:hypothetical protein